MRFILNPIQSIASILSFVMLLYFVSDSINLTCKYPTQIEVIRVRAVVPVVYLLNEVIDTGFSFAEIDKPEFMRLSIPYTISASEFSQRDICNY